MQTRCAGRGARQPPLPSLAGGRRHLGWRLRAATCRGRSGRASHARLPRATSPALAPPPAASQVALRPDLGGSAPLAGPAGCDVAGAARNPAVGVSGRRGARCTVKEAEDPGWGPPTATDLLYASGQVGHPCPPRPPETLGPKWTQTLRNGLDSAAGAGPPSHIDAAFKRCATA